MNAYQYKGSVNVEDNVKLPPINGLGIASETRVLQTTGSVNKPGMVTHTSDCSHSRGLIYRSIPPNPHHYTLSDMLGAGITPPNPVKQKQLGLSGSTSSEFAKRFKSRPTTKPKVIEFNVGRISAEKRRRGMSGFFPPVKLRGSAKSQPNIPSNSEPTSQPNRLQLIPTSYSEVRPKSSRSISRSSRHSKMSNTARKTPDSVRTAPAQESTVQLCPESLECDDLSLLPRPKRILPKRDVPWVFRYKVKKNMNELSKIMASRPQQLVDV